MLKDNITGTYIAKHKLLDRHGINDNILQHENWKYLCAGQVPIYIFRFVLGEEFIVCGFDNLHFIFLLMP